MRRFVELFATLDRTTSTNAKVEAIRDYVLQAPPEDAAWAIAFLSGRRLKRHVGPAALRAWLVDASGLPEWLVEDAYAHVGDLAETIALLVDGGERDETLIALPLHRWVLEQLRPLAGLDDEARREHVTSWWRRLDPETCFLVTKLLTGGLRVGVSETLVARAVAQAAELPQEVVLHRFMGQWEPDADFVRGLMAPDDGSADLSRPYPFCLAHALDADDEGPARQLDDPRAWQVEWKWDGIRAQLVKRQGQVFLWSRGRELVTERFPEVVAAAAAWPDGLVLDGELLAWSEDDGVLPFAQLQRRLNRKTVGAKLLREVPVRLLAYDLLERDGVDLRERPTSERRAGLDELAGQHDSLHVSPLLDEATWQALAARRAEARERGVEGLMLKACDAPYAAGRKTGLWWKWKLAPLTVDAVLLYAQAGHGRRSTLHTDYTFGVWQDDQLVPIAKAYSGLDDGEIQELDRWIRRHTKERFGPVRSVEAEHVFELAFEGIAASTRHKSGVAVRFPRIARWRRDLGVADADTLDHVRDLAGLGA